MPNGVSNSGFKINKCSVKLIRPLKFVFGTQNWFERCQNVTKLHVVCYLVNQTKPTPYVCYVLGGRKVLRSAQVLGQRLQHGQFVDTETSKVNRTFSKLELVRVENDSRPSNQGQEFNATPPVLLWSIIIRSVLCAQNRL